MKKILIIGCPGAGKSTFARKLQTITGLPLHYLDMIYHLPDKTTRSREEFDARITEIIAGDAWIIDGNYMRTMEARLSRCDTVFFLDVPLDVCLTGAESRIGSPREDMPWVETEFDPAFKAWIRAFPVDTAPRIRALLSLYRDRVRVMTFTSREEAERYLAALDTALRAEGDTT